MAKKMGFCIRIMTPGCGVYYSINKGWVSGDSDEVALWSLESDAQQYSRAINVPTEVVPYVDRPLERPEPYEPTAKNARCRIHELLVAIDTIRLKVDPTKSFGTTSEFEKLPASYCQALNLMESARKLLESAKEALEPKPNKAVSFVVDKTDEDEDY